MYDHFKEEFVVDKDKYAAAIYHGIRFLYFGVNADQPSKITDFADESSVIKDPLEHFHSEVLEFEAAMEGNDPLLEAGDVLFTMVAVMLQKKKLEVNTWQIQNILEAIEGLHYVKMCKPYSERNL